MLHDPKRRLCEEWDISPVAFERRQMMRRKGVQETRGYSIQAVKVIEAARDVSEQRESKRGAE